MLRGILGGFARGRRQTSGPTLLLNFLDGLNDSRITYSGGANGTRVNSAGVIVAATTPRFDYDPVTLAAKGLLVEEARTNLLLRSEDLTNASWVDNGVPGGTPTRTANTNTAPSGALTADTITDSDAANRVGIVQGAVVPNDALTRVFSLFILKTSGATSFPGIQLQYTTGGVSITAAITINTNDGTLTDRTTFSPAAKGVEDFNTYWRVWLSFANNTSGNTVCACYLYPAVNTDASGTWVATATGSVVAWGAQLETGAFPTSYISTTTATVARTADTAVMTGTNFSSWYNQTQGTFVVIADSADYSGTRVALAAGDSALAFGAAEVLYASFTSGASGRMAFSILDAGVSVASVSPATTEAVNTPVKFAVAYELNNVQAATKTVLSTLDSSATIPTPTGMSIGSAVAGWSSGASYINGHIQFITYYSRRASNEQLQALTA